MTGDMEALFRLLIFILVFFLLPSPTSIPSNATDPQLVN